MIEINNLINLNTYSQTEKLLFEGKYLVQDHFTFEVSITSNRFSGASNFCVSKSDIKLFVEDLADMNVKLEGIARLCDFDSDGFIEFLMYPLGKVSIRGQLGGSHQDQFLKFKFETDQTVLQAFRSDLDKLSKYEDRNEP